MTPSNQATSQCGPNDCNPSAGSCTNGACECSCAKDCCDAKATCCQQQPSIEASYC